MKKIFIPSILFLIIYDVLCCSYELQIRSQRCVFGSVSVMSIYLQTKQKTLLFSVSSKKEIVSRWLPGAVELTLK